MHHNIERSLPGRSTVECILNGIEEGLITIASSAIHLIGRRGEGGFNPEAVRLLEVEFNGFVVFIWKWASFNSTPFAAHRQVQLGSEQYYAKLHILGPNYDMRLTSAFLLFF